jgi:hypothetical protein
MLLILETDIKRELMSNNPFWIIKLVPVVFIAVMIKKSTFFQTAIHSIAAR